MAKFDNTLLSAHKTLIQAADGRSQADVYEVKQGQHSYIIKDYSARPKLFQMTICRWQLKREWLALLKLRHLSHVPKPIFRNDNQLVMSKLPLAKNSLNQANCAALERQIRKIHQSGVCHNDLHSRNLMLDPRHAYIFDFGAASFKAPNNRTLVTAIQHKFFAVCCFVDRMSVVKYKWKRNRQLLRHDEAKFVSVIEQSRWISRAWRRFKQWRKAKPAPTTALPHVSMSQGAYY
ncbi:phosphotransferase [Neiella marina]|uniref:non-specific serine/threonine protein kinase n=1 Tax=Neiella holothuriorum TaxID=2870530 RepID=A0ABS7EGK4_9GAMM|nr:RIO1 family regulatory kinase/ATPase [Neiella holothuriorum]MBW8191476.1 phosphotransferase [Neiella holothuriorum]